MDFAIEQECPQCGAPIDLDETDRLIRCPYCTTKNILFARDYFRLLLPHKAPDKDIIYAPYMRFKGAVYLCTGTSIGHRIVDITYRGAALTQLPVSLGLRPQAMKMRFATPEVDGSFLKSSLSPVDVLNHAERHSYLFGSDACFHRAYIGEALSLIYLPLFIREDMIFDAVTNTFITTLPQGEDVLRPDGDKTPRWRITFLATICPRCGWNLEGERDSVVLTCSNCDTAWEPSEGGFAPVAFRVVPSRNEEAVYLPFWKITAHDEGLGLNSYADFIRLTRRPKVVQAHWENQALSFWIPAFKIRPTVFLRLARQMTIAQRDFASEKKILKRLYPVTLPRSEAVQSLKITLAGAAVRQSEIFPLLPQINFTMKEFTLVYIPFREMVHDMFQEQMSISVNKNALKFGRYL